MKAYVIFGFLFTMVTITAQVGIGTKLPTETFHVNGTVRIENITSTTATRLAGANDQGTINNVVVGENLSLDSGTLNALGTEGYGVASVSIPVGAVNQQFDDVDLGVDGVNNLKTVIRLIDRTNNYQFSGIAGGTEGRHIVLLNIPTTNFKILNQDTSSLAENRIITLSGNFVTTTGQGSAELVYDGILQRWILINLRN